MDVFIRPEDLFGNKDIFCIIIDGCGEVKYLNDYTLNTLNYSKDDVYTQSCFETLFLSYKNSQKTFVLSLERTDAFWIEITKKNGETLNRYSRITYLNRGKDIYLITSEPEYHSNFEVFNSLKEGLIIADDKAQIVACNDEASRILCEPKTNMLNKKLGDFIHVNHCEDIGSVIEKVFKTKEEISFNTEIISGKNRAWVFISVFLYKDKNQKDIGIVVSIKNASDYKILKDELEHKEKLERAVFMDFPLATITWKFSGGDYEISDFNKEADKFTDYKISGLIGVRAGEFFKANKEIFEAIDNTYKTGITGKIETHYKLKTTNQHKYLNGTTVKLNSYGVQLYIEDATARKETEEKLLKSEAFYRAVVEDQTEMIFRCDEKGVINYSNEAFLRYFNIDRETVFTNTFYDFFKKDSVKSSFDFEYEINDNKTAIFELEVVCDSQPRWNQWVFRAMTNSDQNFLGYQAVGRDITDRKIFEEMLKQKKEELEAIFSVFPDTFLRIGENMAVYNFLGKSNVLNIDALEISGKSLNEIIPDILYFQFEEMIKKALKEKSQENTEFWWEDEKQGNDRYYEARFIPVSKLDVVIVIRDITAKKIYEEEIKRAKDELEIRVEERTKDLLDSKMKLEIQIAERIKMEEEKRSIQSQLFQVQKMEALGVFAGGIAHDFNNLMNIVNAYTQMLLWSIPEAEQGYGDLLEIQNAVNKASSLTHQLLIFSRQGNSEKHRIDLNEKIVEMVKMIKRIIDNNIKVEISQDENIEAINADPVNLEQVIMNLVVNARDAMPKGGVITIKTGVPSDAKIERPDKAGNEDNSYVYFEISDTGAGMDEETLSRIFEPFYTTKSRSKGTGLGLSVVYGIVDEHEGYIKVKSTPGKGTSFKVYLPVYSKKHVKPNLTVDGERIADSKGECILIIEDEAALLSVSSRALISRGYKTLLASNGEEARKIFKERKYEISLIFSDVMLPDENGILLVKDLKEDKGDVKVLLTSGYAGEKYNLEETISGDIKHIPKPYKLPVLFAKIREMLD